MNVTELIENGRDIYPTVFAYLERVVKSARRSQPFDKDFFPSYQHPSRVDDEQLYPHIGIFYGYLVRRELMLQNGLQIRDSNAEVIKSFISNCDDSRLRPFSGGGGGQLNNDKLRKIAPQLLDSYEIYKDAEKSTVDILEHVFATSNLQTLRSRKPPISLEGGPLWNEETVRSALAYANRLSADCEQLCCNVPVACAYFVGVFDFAMRTADHFFIAKIKSSKYGLDSDDFLKVIFYAFGLYLQEGKCHPIEQFRIYNPLLDREYRLVIPDLDFEELEMLFNNPYGSREEVEF